MDLAGDLQVRSSLPENYLLDTGNDVVLFFSTVQPQFWGFQSPCMTISKLMDRDLAPEEQIFLATDVSGVMIR